MLGVALLLLAAGGLGMLALLLGGLEGLLFDTGRRLLWRSFVPPPIVMTAGFALLWLAMPAGDRTAARLAAPAAVALLAVSLMLVVGLPLSWLISLSGAVAGVGLFERSLVLAGIVGVLASPVVYLTLRRAVSVEAWWRGPVLRGFATRGELVLLGAILLLFGIIVVRFIAIGSIFGFDESIYALTARSWVQGTPATGWSSHRSPGISLLGVVALPFGTWEAPFRIIGLVFGLGALVACWRLARQMGGPAAGLLAALAVAAVPDLQLNAAAFLTDVPSSALLMVMMLLAWRCFQPVSADGKPDRGLLLLAPVAASAFYVRYGASVPIAFLVATVVLLWPRVIARSWRSVAATIALFLVMLLPHLAFATLKLGSPWAIALRARDLAAPAYPGQGLQIYVAQFFSSVAGPIAGAITVTGLVAAAWQVVATRRIGGMARAYAFLLIPALGMALLLGLVALAQTRYIYVSIMLLAIAGSVGLAGAWRHLPPAVRTASAVLAPSVLAVVMVNAGVSQVARQASYAPTQRDLVVASERIRADALSHSDDGQPHCSVLTYPVPEVTWYSGCAAYHFGYPAQAGREAQLTTANRYLLLLEGTTIRQPQGEMLEGYLRLVDPAPIAVVRDPASGKVASRVYRFRTSTSGG